ncbi:MAG: DUF983 domain-containing protein [Sphingomicrobium sp.]
MAGGSPSEPDPLARAIRGHCPQCDFPGLFAGLVKFADRCRGCGLDFAGFNVGDGAAAFLIFIVGGLVTVGAIWLELAASPPYWVHIIWVPVTVALTLLGLRLGKAGLLAQEYKHRAREGRIVK